MPDTHDTLQAAAAQASAQPWPYPRWIAHRGAGKLAPENTLAALRVGAAHGYRAFECDVKLSADGQPFLLHDATLARTARTPHGGHAPDTVAGHLAWAALAGLDVGSWLGRTWAGEPIPLLDNIAAFCLRNGHALNIEIKPTPGDEARTGTVVAQAADRLWRDAVAAGESPWPLLSSFSPDALVAARQAYPHLPRALLLDSLPSDHWAQARALDCAAVVLNYRVLTHVLLNWLHAQGWRVLVYTVNEADAAAQLLDEGIDGIITDAVDRFSPGWTQGAPLRRA